MCALTPPTPTRLSALGPYVPYMPSPVQTRPLSSSPTLRLGFSSSECSSRWAMGTLSRSAASTTNTMACAHHARSRSVLWVKEGGVCGASHSTGCACPYLAPEAGPPHNTTAANSCALLCLCHAVLYANIQCLGSYGPRYAPILIWMRNYKDSPTSYGCCLWSSIAPRPPAHRGSTAPTGSGSAAGLHKRNGHGEYRNLKRENQCGRAK